jgi:hypothetical protein
MAAIIFGAFSGFIAFAIGENLIVKNTGKDSGSWLFIIEGAVVIAVGVAIWLLSLLSPKAGM